jgi:copper(I)-binding protein
MSRLVRIATIGCGLLHVGDAVGYGLLSVNQPWAKPGVKTSEAYMVLTSSEGATLIGARSSLAERVDVLASAQRRGPMFSLPAGMAVVFRPGGKHFTLSGLSRPLKLGDRVPLVLTIEAVSGARSEIAIEAEVRNESPIDAELRAHRGALPARMPHR